MNPRAETPSLLKQAVHGVSLLQQAWYGSRRLQDTVGEPQYRGAAGHGGGLCNGSRGLQPGGGRTASYSPTASFSLRRAWEARQLLQNPASHPSWAALAHTFYLWYIPFMSTPLSIRTVCCKLAVDAAADAALRQTQAAFNAAASYCASVAWNERVTNKNKLHYLVYAESRITYGLGAQLACCARDKAAEAVRAVRAAPERRYPDTDQVIPKTCPTFDADSSIRYDARTYRLLSLDRVSLNTLAGRIVGQLVLGDFQRRYLYNTSWKIGGAELMRRADVWYLCITQSKAAPAPDEPVGYLGVDLGIVNLAADSDGETYSGQQIQAVRKRRYDHGRRLQLANTRRARWRLRQNASREHRFQKDTNHRISKALVQKATRERKALALEDLEGIRARVTVRRTQRRVRHAWAFRQLRTFIGYKATQTGVRVVFVDPRNTSRTCAVCGNSDKRNRPDQAHFRCRACGHTAAADTNAAVNIARVAAVNQPIVSLLSHRIESADTSRAVSTAAVC
jgi:putative transposase